MFVPLFSRNNFSVESLEGTQVGVCEVSRDVKEPSLVGIDIDTLRPCLQEASKSEFLSFGVQFPT
jgi:hypothetical protein